MRKSDGTCADEVAERRDQLNAKSKPTPLMAMRFLQHAKALHAADDMPDILPEMSEHAIFLTLFSREGRRSRARGFSTGPDPPRPR